MTTQRGPLSKLPGQDSCAAPAALKLVDSKMSTTGVAINSYLRAAAIQTGSFALTEPTKAELARREKMAREG